MSNKITVNFLLANKDKLVNAKVSNGIGGKNSISTKLYKWFMHHVLHKEYSFFRDAGIVHDALYYIGNRGRDKFKADCIFWSVMYKTLKESARELSVVTYYRYYLLSFIYFLAVSLFGHKFFNWKDRVTKKRLKEIIN